MVIKDNPTIHIVLRIFLQLQKDVYCCMTCACVHAKGTAVSYQTDVFSTSDVLVMSSTHTVSPVTIHFPTVSHIPYYNTVFIIFITFNYISKCVLSYVPLNLANFDRIC